MENMTDNINKKINVLMIGAGRDVQGGVSTVVNQYYQAGLDNKVNLKYIATMKDGSKITKLIVGIAAYVEFMLSVSKYDMVHVHMSHRSSFYRKRAFIKKAHKAGKKIIIHMHGSEFDVFYDKECNEKKKQKVRDVFELADVVIALSEEWEKWISTICDKRKIKVLYNAVNLPNFKREDYNDSNILFLGRLGKRKGTYDLLKAIPTVLKEVPDAHFYLGGDGDLDQCKSICKENNVESNVTFLGWVSGKNKAKWLEKCSIFVLPSYHEGMPMAILEAMSYGEVVISTKVGGIPKVIEDKKNGFLIDAGDVDSLAQIIVYLLKTPRSEIGACAYRTIENNFNSKANINKLIEIYTSVLEK